MVTSILVSITGLLNQIHHAVITQTRAFVGRNVITQLSTNHIHLAEIPQTSNFYARKYTRPFSSACEGLVPRLSEGLHRCSLPENPDYLNLVDFAGDRSSTK